MWLEQVSLYFTTIYGGWLGFFPAFPAKILTKSHFDADKFLYPAVLFPGLKTDKIVPMSFSSFKIPRPQVENCLTNKPFVTCLVSLLNLKLTQTTHRTEIRATTKVTIYTRMVSRMRSTFLFFYRESNRE